MFNLVTSEFSSYAGTNRLQVRWGHYDSWSYDWYQRQYLDYLYVEELVTPDAPRNLNALDSGTGRLTFSWKSPLNILASSYKIYRYIDSSWTLLDTETHIGTINDGQLWTVSGLSPGIIYRFRFAAVNSQGTMGAYAYWTGEVDGGII